MKKQVKAYWITELERWLPNQWRFNVSIKLCNFIICLFHKPGNNGESNKVITLDIKKTDSKKEFFTKLWKIEPKLVILMVCYNKGIDKTYTNSLKERLYELGICTTNEKIDSIT